MSFGDKQDSIKRSRDNDVITFSVYDVTRPAHKYYKQQQEEDGISSSKKGKCKILFFLMRNMDTSVYVCDEWLLVVLFFKLMSVICVKCTCPYSIAYYKPQDCVYLSSSWLEGQNLVLMYTSLNSASVDFCYFLTPWTTHIMVHVPKDQLGRFWRQTKSSKISETEEAMDTKFGVHACHITLYLHEFFEPIPID